MKKLIIVFLVALAGVGFFNLPRLAVFYVNNNYPGIKTTSASLHLNGISFHNVSINKDSIVADVEKVHVFPNKDIWIFARSVTVNSTDSSEKQSNSSVTFIYSEKVTINRNGLTIHGNRLNYSHGIYFIPSGDINFKSEDFTFENLLIQDNKITIGKADKRLSKRFFNQDVSTITAYDIQYYNGIVTVPRIVLDSSIELRDSYLDVGSKTGDISSITVTNNLYSKEALSIEDISFDLKLGQISGGGIDLTYSDGEISIYGKCNSWVNLIFKDPEFAKNYSGHFELYLNLEKREIKLINNCSIICNNSHIIKLLSGFEYTAYRSNGETFSRKCGPNSLEWATFASIPETVIHSFVGLEDPAFFRHNGILNASLNVALSQNMEKGYIYRGGSTITQQLAKNLYLTREKTLERKAKEVFLAILLESCLNKEQILELYVNIVEFGPDIYGIGPAAKYHFNKIPAELTPEEGIYLAMILPNPKKAKANPSDMERARRLMKRLVESGSLPEVMLTDVSAIDLTDWETHD